MPQALSLEEKGHRDVEGLSAGPLVFVKESYLLLQPLPKSAAEATALVLGKSRSHQSSSCCSLVGLGAQKKVAEDPAGGDSCPQTPHTGPLWVTGCKSLDCVPTIRPSALGRVLHVPSAQRHTCLWLPSRQESLHWRRGNRVLLAIGSERLARGGARPLGGPTHWR